ncbi:hypothetical protein [Mycobacterium sp. PSTR-4-N]|uniref:hypothetical protein n=1 Tax=Mycobacterium sp. PSTR-4-N TaxID=2917745 RepID=UPI001F156D63|nr:hypothetical protein [Mycobacterium sp. PSTR-4-N]MCG7594953.1 hypothetical protein [Mycobacterium sp. PSTR-4-N]
MASFSRLRANWLTWTTWAGMSNPSVVAEDGNEDAVFKSDDQTCHLQHDGEWWVLDVTNDRGKFYPAAAKFSSFELAEKYLIWDWATSLRSDLASGPLGTDLYKLGYSPSVKATEVRLGFVELSGDAGTAALSTVNATIFSHLMAKPVEEIERLVNVGMGPTQALE